jgi:hypothetical protein
MKRNEIANLGNVAIFHLKGENAALEVQLKNETVWLWQEQIAVLFGTKRPAVTKHFSNIFNCKELDKDSVCSVLELAAVDGKNTRLLL